MAEKQVQVIVVAVEDSATGSVVAAAAARLAMERDAVAVVLLHVLENHAVISGMNTVAGVMTPVVETTEEGERVLALADAALRAEYAALDKPVPALTHELAAGEAGAAIAQVARDAGGTLLVVGARRPHAFGRLTHPDVRASLTRQTPAPVHVVPLQADPHAQNEPPGATNM